MKEGLFILALLIVSSYAINVQHPGQENVQRVDNKNLKPTPPKQSPGSASSFRAKKLTAIKEAAKQRNVLQAEAAAAAVAAAHADLTVTADNSSSSTGVGHVKHTPGAQCSVYTTCVDCTDDTSKAFYCMWSAARNVCQEDTDMDKLKRSNPEDLWTKQCAPKTPDPITDCGGCPILAVDKKPARDIVDSKIKGSNGDEVSAVEGDLKLLGTDPHDPVTGPITNPNGTYGPQYLLPSIRDEDGNIKDPVQDPVKLTYSPCVGDGTCGASSRFMSSTRKGKFTPDLLKDGDTASNDNDADDEPRMKQSHRPHVDKVEMQDAQMDETDTAADEPKREPSDTSALEVSARVTVTHTDEPAAATPAPGGGFTPAFSDDDTSASSPATVTTKGSNAAAASAPSSSDDAPRFKESKRSEFRGMSAEKTATQPKENTMEVTEFDDNVVGGKRINEDADDKPTKEEADDKQ